MYLCCLQNFAWRSLYLSRTKAARPESTNLSVLGDSPVSGLVTVYPVRLPMRDAQWLR